jgi:hypothetical protein
LAQAVGHLPVVPSPAAGCEGAGGAHHLSLEVADLELVVRWVCGDPARPGVVGRGAAGPQARFAFFVWVVWFGGWSHGLTL